MSKNSQEEHRKNIFYEASVNAWYQTKLEVDKSLLTLSAGGVGILVAIITDVKSAESFILYILALLSFISCIIIILYILQKNAKHIELICSESPNIDKSTSQLRCLDIFASICFAVGVLFTAIIGTANVANHLLGETHMKDKTTESGISRLNQQGSIRINSFSGAEAMRPKPPSPQNTGGTSTQGTTTKPSNK